MEILKWLTQYNIQAILVFMLVAIIVEIYIIPIITLNSFSMHVLLFNNSCNHYCIIWLLNCVKLYLNIPTTGSWSFVVNNIAGTELKYRNSCIKCRKSCIKCRVVLNVEIVVLLIIIKVLMDIIWS